MATDGIAHVKEMFKVTGNKKTFTKPRRSINENKHLFEKSFTASNANMSMSMKQEYQNFEGRFEVGDRKSSQQAISRKPF